MASQNSCTPLGTPVDVTLARKKNASPITITAAIAVASTVSVLTVSPNQWASVWWPTWIPDSAARIVSVIAVWPPLRVRPC